MENILKISEAASLALHAVAYLADRTNEKLSNKDIAAAIKVSEAHLSKVMQRLNKAGIVRSIRGPKGGFTLAKDPVETRLLDVYEAIEGPLPNNYCLIGSPVCAGDKCILGDLLGNLNNEVRDYLEKTRLSDLTEVFGEEEQCIA
jgi:Rrf2 family protein